MTIKRGDIYYADLSPVVGSEQGGVRPVLIVQNDVGNRYSPTVIAAAITSQHDKANLPTHIQVQGNASGLTRDSNVLHYFYALFIFYKKCLKIFAVRVYKIKNL